MGIFSTERGLSMTWKHQLRSVKWSSKHLVILGEIQWDLVGQFVSVFGGDFGAGMAQNLLHHGFSAWMKPHWPAISDVHHWGLHGFSSAAKLPGCSRNLSSTSPASPASSASSTNLSCHRRELGGSSHGSELVVGQTTNRWCERWFF